MVYIRDGAVQQKRSPWRASIVTDLFWGIINLIVSFFQTLISPTAQAEYRSRKPPSGGGSGGSGAGGRGGGPRIIGMDRFSNPNHVNPCGGGG